MELATAFSIMAGFGGAVGYAAGWISSRARQLQAYRAADAALDQRDRAMTALNAETRRATEAEGMHKAARGALFDVAGKMKSVGYLPPCFGTFGHGGLCAVWACGIRGACATTDYQAPRGMFTNDDPEAIHPDRHTVLDARGEALDVKVRG